MRVSVIKEDPGYIGKYATGYQVYLNGEKLDQCITADEEECFSLVYDTDDQGEIMLNEEGTDTIRKYVYGDIKIIAPPFRDRFLMKAKGIYHRFSSIPFEIDLAWYKLRKKLRHKLKSMVEQ